MQRLLNFLSLTRMIFFKIFRFSISYKGATRKYFFYKSANKCKATPRCNQNLREQNATYYIFKELISVHHVAFPKRGDGISTHRIETNRSSFVRIATARSNIFVPRQPPNLKFNKTPLTEINSKFSKPCISPLFLLSNRTTSQHCLFNNAHARTRSIIHTHAHVQLSTRTPFKKDKYILQNCMIKWIETTTAQERQPIQSISLLKK